MTATEGKKDQEQLQKLAVPGLEIGDKIDIFFFNYTSLETTISTHSSSGFAKATRCFPIQYIAR